MAGRAAASYSDTPRKDYEAARGRRDRAAILRDIEHDLRRKAKAKLRALNIDVQTAKLRHDNALKEVAVRCRTERLAVNDRAAMRRLIVLDQLRDAIRKEREAARSTCSIAKQKAHEGSIGAVEKARAAYAAEQKYQLDLKEIEQGNRSRRRERAPRASAKERRSESDDEVLANIPAEYAPLWERVKRSIKADAHQSRTEAFLKYAEEHPREVLEAADDESERALHALIREREQTERRATERRPKRRRYTAAELADVPF